MSRKKYIIKWQKNNPKKVKIIQKRYELKHRKKCKDCGKLINRHNKRCLKCYAKIKDIRLRNQKGNKNVNWKGKVSVRGKKHINWKGNKVSYRGLHQWVRRNKPKVELCEKCNKEKSYDVANISGKYKRDIKDYEWLCRKCHNNNHPKKRDKRGRFVKRGKR